MQRSKNELTNPSFSRLRKGCSLGRISKKHSARRKELLRFVNNQEYNSYISVSIAEKLTREINEVASYNEQTAEFVNEIREKLFLLHEYNTHVAKIAYTYPTSKEIYELLGRYVALESDVLYKNKYDFKYERQVEERVFRTIVTFLKNSSSTEDNCLSEERNHVYNEALKIFISNVDFKYTSDEEKFPARIVKNVLDALGLIKKSPSSSGGHLDLNNPSLIRLKESLKDSDYGSDDDGQETASVSSESSFRTILTRRNNEVKKETSNYAVNTFDTAPATDSSESPLTLQSTSDVPAAEPRTSENLIVESAQSSLLDSRCAEKQSSGLKSLCNSSNSQSVPNFPSSNEVFSSVSKDDILSFVDLNVDDDIEVIRWSQRKSTFPQPQLQRHNFPSSSNSQIPSKVGEKIVGDKRDIEYRIYDTISILSSEDEEEDFDCSSTNFDGLEKKLREQRRKHELLSNLDNTPHQKGMDKRKNANTTVPSKSHHSYGGEVSSIRSELPREQEISNKSSDLDTSRSFNSAKSIKKCQSLCSKRNERKTEKLWNPENIIDISSSDEEEPVDKNLKDTLVKSSFSGNQISLTPPGADMDIVNTSRHVESTVSIQPKTIIGGENEEAKIEPSSMMGRIFCRSIDQLTNNRNLVSEHRKGKQLLKNSEESVESVLELGEKESSSEETLEEKIIRNTSPEKAKEPNSLNNETNVSFIDSDIEIISEEGENTELKSYSKNEKKTSGCFMEASKTTESAKELSEFPEKGSKTIDKSAEEPSSSNSALSTDNLNLDVPNSKTIDTLFQTISPQKTLDKNVNEKDTKTRIISDATVSKSTSKSDDLDLDGFSLDSEKLSDDINKQDRRIQSSSDATISDSKSTTSSLNFGVSNRGKHQTRMVEKFSNKISGTETLHANNSTEPPIASSTQPPYIDKNGVIEIIDCDEYEESNIDDTCSSLPSIPVKTEVCVDESDLLGDDPVSSNRNNEISLAKQDIEEKKIQPGIIPFSRSSSAENEVKSTNSTELVLEKHNTPASCPTGATRENDEQVTEMLTNREVQDVDESVRNPGASTLPTENEEQVPKGYQEVETKTFDEHDDKIITEIDDLDEISLGSEDILDSSSIAEDQNITMNILENENTTSTKTVISSNEEILLKDCQDEPYLQASSNSLPTENDDQHSCFEEICSVSVSSPAGLDDETTTEPNVAILPGDTKISTEYKEQLTKGSQEMHSMSSSTGTKTFENEEKNIAENDNSDDEQLPMIKEVTKKDIEPVVRKHRKKELLESQKLENNKPDGNAIVTVELQDLALPIHNKPQISDSNQQNQCESKCLSLNLQEDRNLEKTPKSSKEAIKLSELSDTQNNKAQKAEETKKIQEKRKRQELYKSSEYKVSLEIPDIDSVLKDKSKLNRVDNSSRRSLRSNSSTVSESPLSKTTRKSKSSCKVKNDDLILNENIQNIVEHAIDVGKEEEISAASSTEISISSLENIEGNTLGEPPSNSFEVKENEQKHVRETDNNIRHPCKIAEKESIRSRNRKTKILYDTKQESSVVEYQPKISHSASKNRENIIIVSKAEVEPKTFDENDDKIITGIDDLDEISLGSEDILDSSSIAEDQNNTMNILEDENTTYTKTVISSNEEILLRDCNSPNSFPTENDDQHSCSEKICSVSVSSSAGLDDETTTEPNVAILSSDTKILLRDCIDEPDPQASPNSLPTENDDQHSCFEEICSVSVSSPAGLDDETTTEPNVAILPGDTKISTEYKEQLTKGSQQMHSMSSCTGKKTFENEEKNIAESDNSDEIPLGTEVTTDSLSIAENQNSPVNIHEKEHVISFEETVIPANNDILIEEYCKDRNCDKPANSLPMENDGPNSCSVEVSLEEDSAVPSFDGTEYTEIIECKDNQNTEDDKVLLCENEHTVSTFEATFDNENVEDLEVTPTELCTATMTTSKEEILELNHSENFSIFTHEKVFEIPNEKNEFVADSIEKTEENHSFEEVELPKGDPDRIDLIEDTTDQEKLVEFEHSKTLKNVENIEELECNQYSAPSASENVYQENQFLDSNSLFICSEQEIETQGVEYDYNVEIPELNFESTSIEETVVYSSTNSPENDENNSSTVKCSDISTVEDVNRRNEMLEVSEDSENHECSMEKSIKTSFDVENKLKTQSVEITTVKIPPNESESKEEYSNSPNEGSRNEIRVPHSSCSLVDQSERRLRISPSLEDMGKDKLSEKSIFVTDKEEESKEQSEFENINKPSVGDAEKGDSENFICGVAPLIENCMEHIASPEKILYDDECSTSYVIDEGEADGNVEHVENLEVELLAEDPTHNPENYSTNKMIDESVSVVEICVPNNIADCETITLGIDHSETEGDLKNVDSDQEAPIVTNQTSSGNEEDRDTIKIPHLSTTDCASTNSQSDDLSQQINVIDETSSTALNKLGSLDVTPKKPKSRCSDSHNVVGNLGKMMLLMSNTEPRRPKRSIPFTSPIKMSDACTKFDTSPTTPNTAVLDMVARDSTYSSYCTEIENNPSLNITPKPSAFNSAFPQCETSTLYSPTTFYSSYTPTDLRDNEVFFNIKECESQKQQLNIDILASVASNQKPLKVDNRPKKSSIVNAAKSPKCRKSLKINITENNQTPPLMKNESPLAESTLETNLQSGLFPSITPTPSKTKSKRSKSNSKSPKSEKRKDPNSPKTTSGRKSREEKRKVAKDKHEDLKITKELKISEKTDKRKSRPASKDKKALEVEKTKKSSKVVREVSSEKELIIDRSDSDDSMPLNVRIKKCEVSPVESSDRTRSSKKDYIQKNSPKSKSPKGRGRTKEQKNNTKSKVKVNTDEEVKLVAHDSKQKELDTKIKITSEKPEKNEQKVVTSPDQTRRIVHFKKAMLELISQDLDENNARNSIMNELDQTSKPIVSKKLESSDISSGTNDNQLNQECLPENSQIVESELIINENRQKLQNSISEIVVEELNEDFSKLNILKPAGFSQIGETRPRSEGNLDRVGRNHLNIYISPLSNSESEVERNNDEIIETSIKELGTDIEMVSENRSSSNAEHKHSGSTTIDNSTNDAPKSDEQLPMIKEVTKKDIEPVVRKHRKKELLESQKLENNKPDENAKVTVELQDLATPIHNKPQISESNQQNQCESKCLSLNLQDDPKLKETPQSSKEAIKLSELSDIQNNKAQKAEETEKIQEKRKRQELHKSSEFKVSLEIPDIDSVLKDKFKLNRVDNSSRRSLRSNSSTVSESPLSKTTGKSKSSCKVKNDDLILNENIQNIVEHAIEVGKEEEISAASSTEISISSLENIEGNTLGEPPSNSFEVKENEQKHVRETDNNIRHPCKIAEKESIRSRNRKTKILYDTKQDSSVVEYQPKISHSATKNRENIIIVSKEETIEVPKSKRIMEEIKCNQIQRKTPGKNTPNPYILLERLSTLDTDRKKIEEKPRRSKRKRSGSEKPENPSQIKRDIETVHQGVIEQGERNESKEKNSRESKNALKNEYTDAKINQRKTRSRRNKGASGEKTIATVLEKEVMNNINSVVSAELSNENSNLSTNRPREKQDKITQNEMKRIELIEDNQTIKNSTTRVSNNEQKEESGLRNSSHMILNDCNSSCFEEDKKQSLKENEIEPSDNRALESEEKNYDEKEKAEEIELIDNASASAMKETKNIEHIIDIVSEGNYIQASKEINDDLESVNDTNSETIIEEKNIEHSIEIVSLGNEIETSKKINEGSESIDVTSSTAIIEENSIEIVTEGYEVDAYQSLSAECESIDDTSSKAMIEETKIGVVSAGNEINVLKATIDDCESIEDTSSGVKMEELKIEIVSTGNEMDVSKATIDDCDSIDDTSSKVIIEETKIEINVLKATIEDFESIDDTSSKARIEETNIEFESTENEIDVLKSTIEICEAIDDKSSKAMIEETNIETVSTGNEIDVLKATIEDPECINDTSYKVMIEETKIEIASTDSEMNILKATIEDSESIADASCKAMIEERTIEIASTENEMDILEATIEDCESIDDTCSKAMIEESMIEIVSPGIEIAVLKATSEDCESIDDLKATSDDTSAVAAIEEKNIENSIEIVSKGNVLDTQKELCSNMGISNEEEVSGLVQSTPEDYTHVEIEDKVITDEEIKILAEPFPFDTDQNSSLSLKDVVLKSEEVEGEIEKNLIGGIEEKYKESDSIKTEHNNESEVETRYIEILSDSCMSSNQNTNIESEEKFRKNASELLTVSTADTHIIEYEDTIEDDFAIIETIEVSEQAPPDSEDKSLNDSKNMANIDEESNSLTEIELKSVDQKSVEVNKELVESQGSEESVMRDEKKDLVFPEILETGDILQVDESVNKKLLQNEINFENVAMSSDQEIMDEVHQKELLEETQLGVEITVDINSPKNKRKYSEEQEAIEELITPKKCKIHIIQNEIIQPACLEVSTNEEKSMKVELEPSNSTEGIQGVPLDKLQVPEISERNAFDEVVEYDEVINDEHSISCVENIIHSTEYEVGISEEIVIYSENSTDDTQLEGVAIDIPTNLDENESTAIENVETMDESQCFNNKNICSASEENKIQSNAYEESCYTSDENPVCVQYSEEKSLEPEHPLNLSVHQHEKSSIEKNISSEDQSSDLPSSTVQGCSDKTEIIQKPKNELSFSIERMLESSSKSETKEKYDFIQNEPLEETSKKDTLEQSDTKNRRNENAKIVTTSTDEKTNTFKHPGKLHKDKLYASKKKSNTVCGKEEKKKGNKKTKPNTKLKVDDHSKVIVERVYSYDELAGGAPISPCINYCSAPIMPISTELIPYRFGVYGTVIPTAERIIMNNTHFNSEVVGNVDNSNATLEVPPRNTGISQATTENIHEKNKHTSTPGKIMESEKKQISESTISNPTCEILNDTQIPRMSENEIEIVQVESHNDFGCESQIPKNRDSENVIISTAELKNDEKYGTKNMKCDDEMYDQDENDIDESIMKEVQQIQNRSDSSTSSEIMRDDVELFDSILGKTNSDKQIPQSSRNVDKPDFTSNDDCSTAIHMITGESDKKTEGITKSIIDSRPKEQEPQPNVIISLNSELNGRITESSTGSNILGKEDLCESSGSKPLEDFNEKRTLDKMELNIENSRQQFTQNVNHIENMPMKLTDIASATLSAYGMKGLNIDQEDKFKVSDNELNKCPIEPMPQSNGLESTKGSFSPTDVSSLFDSTMGQADITDSFVNKNMSSGSEGMESLLTSFQSALSESIAQNISSLQGSFSLFSSSDSNLEISQDNQAQNENIIVNQPEGYINRLSLPESTPLRLPENAQADDTILNMSYDYFDFDFNPVNQGHADGGYSNQYTSMTEFLRLLYNLNDVGCEVTVDDSHVEDIGSKPNDFISPELIQEQLIDSIPPYIAEEEFDSNAPTDPMVGGQKELIPDPKQDSNLDETPFPVSALSFDEDMMHCYASFMHCDVNSSEQSCTTNALNSIQISEKQFVLDESEKPHNPDISPLSQQNIKNFDNVPPLETENTPVLTTPQISENTPEIIPETKSEVNVIETDNSSSKTDVETTYNQECSKKYNSSKTLSPNSSMESNKSSNKTTTKHPVKVQKIPASKYAPPKKLRNNDTSRVKKSQDKAEEKQSKKLIDEEKSENLSLNIEPSNFLDMPQLLSPTENISSKRKSAPTSHKSEPKTSKIEVPQVDKTPDKSPVDDTSQLMQYNMYDRTKAMKRNAARVQNYCKFYDNDSSSSSNKNKKRKLANKAEPSSEKQEIHNHPSPPNIKEKSLERRETFNEFETRSKKPKVAEPSVKEVRNSESHKPESSKTITSTPKNPYGIRDLDSEFDKLKNSDPPVPYKHSSSKPNRYTRTDRILRSAQEGEGYHHQVPSTSSQYGYSDRGKREEPRRYPESSRKAEEDYRRKHKVLERPRSTHSRSGSYTTTPNDHRRDPYRRSTQSEIKKFDAWHGRESHKTQSSSEDRRRTEGHYARDSNQRVERWLKRDCQPEHRPSASQSQQKSADEWLKTIDELWPPDKKVF